MAGDDGAVPVAVNEPFPQEESSAEEKAKETEAPTVSYGELFKYADCTDRILMALGVLGGMITGCSMPAFSEIFGRFMDTFSAEGGLQPVAAELAIIMVVVGCINFVGGFMQVACLISAANRQTMKIRRFFVAALIRQDIGWFDQHKPGELGTRLAVDIRQMKEGMGEKLGVCVRNTSMCIGGYVIAFYRSWRLTLIMMATSPIMFVVGGIIGGVTMSKTKLSQERYAKAGAIASESLENCRTTQVMNLQENRVESYEEHLEVAREAGVQKGRTEYVGVGVVFLAIFSTYGIGFFYSSFLVENNHNSVGDIITAFFASVMGNMGLGLLFQSIAALSTARASAYAVFATINRTPTIDVEGGGQVLDASRSGDIELKDVHFKYPTRDEELFKGFSIKIQSGKTTAFSGMSGSGKSSVIQLLQRFYDPASGSVLVGGTDLKDMDIAQWRSQIGIVSQEPNLFSGTVAENVRVGDPTATMEDIHEACKKANIHDTIMKFPDGYDAQLGSLGSQLSGGQKQRIAIARAILKNPPLMLLDEATSALDRRSEMEVQRSLEQAAMGSDGKPRTVVVVAHRLTTIRNADKIYFLSPEDSGTNTGTYVAEHGTYDELMKKNGQFAAMARGQLKIAEASGIKGSGADAAESEVTVDSASFVDVKDAYPEEEPYDTSNAGIGRVMSMSRPYMWANVLGCVGSFISGLVWPGYAIVLPRLLEVLARGTPDEIREKAKIWSAMFFAIGVAAFIGFSLMSFFAVAGEGLTKALRSKLFRSLLRQDQAFFDRPGRESATLSTLISGATEDVHQLLGPALGVKIQSMTSILAGTIIAFIYAWQLALLSLAAVPFVIVSGLSNAAMVTGVNQGSTGPLDQAEGMIQEALSNIRTVVSFNYGRILSRKFGELVDLQTPIAHRGAIIAGLGFGLGQFATFGAFALNFWYGAGLLDDGDISMGDMLTASMAVLMGGMGAGESSGYQAKVEDAKGSAIKVFEIIDRVPPAACDSYGDGGSRDVSTAKSIRAEDVAFIYPTRPKNVVLHHFNTTIEQGSQIGLTGPTGCGKSTLIQLLCRFYLPARGAITVCGQPLSDINVTAWRDELAAVFQEPALYSGTVRENILLGNPKASNDEVEEMCKLACIHDDIVSMPQGYDTTVGAKGNQLSGGQKQRVAIARALLRNPSILLLDEATSALDGTTEARVVKNLLDYAAQRKTTVISVAHRLTTITHCDNIILLDDGVCLEEGSHQRLMQIPNGEYRARYEQYMQST